MNEELMDGKDRLLEEIRQLKEVLKGVREERDYLFNKLSNEKLWLQQENQQLKQENKALMLLLEWMTECDFGLDNIFNEEDINMTEEKFEKATENMEYNESLIYYAELYLQVIKGEDKECVKK